MALQQTLLTDFAGHFGSRSGVVGVSATPAPQRLRAESLNMGIAAAALSNSSSLGLTGSRPQDQDFRAPLVAASGPLAASRVMLNRLDDNQTPSNDPPHDPPQKKGKQITVKIGSFNTKGKRNSHRNSKYKDITTLLRRNHFFIMGLQETKLCENEHLTLMRQNPKIYIESNPGPHSKAGVAFLINKDLLPKTNNDQPQWIHTILIEGRASRLTIEWNEQRLDIINLYLPNLENEKINCLEQLYARLINLDDLVEPIFMGDFNFVEDAIDRIPHRRDKNKIIEAWKKIEERFNLTDGWRTTHPTKKDYSFSQNNMQGISLSRIDRIYVSKETIPYTQKWKILPGGNISDHRVMSMEIMKRGLPYIGKGLWKLHPDMVEYPNYANRIRKLLIKTINEMKEKLAENQNIGRLWSNTKKTLQKIGMEEATQRKRKLGGGKYEAEKRLRTNLKRADRDFEKLNETHEIMLEIESIENDQLHSIQLSSQARYQKEGERNTKFFFQLNKERYNPAIITALQNENGRLITETNMMRNIASKHHEKLQSAPVRQPEDANHIMNFLNQVDTHLREDEQNIMESLTTEDETKAALKKSANGVSAGFDGIPYEFYKYWTKKYEEYEEQCKGENKPKKEFPNIIWLLTRVYNEIEETGLEDPAFILGAMHLLYKKNDKTKVENYRPITLTNADYKIFTKSIATKLGNLAQNIIHPNQTGFIPGRGLYDNTRLSEAMISYCDNFELNGVIVALDQEKAYDKIAHDYLWKVLEKFRFPDRFIFKIKQLYSYARTAVMVNGTIGKAIDIKRGVRQGCPMSCLLYNIAIEPLAIALRKSELQGFKIGGSIERILASLFADDTLIYLNEDDDLNILKNIINDFCRASTAKFNLAKTEYLPIGTEQYRKQVITTRRINNTASGIIEENVKIIKEGESLRTLGAWIGNGNNQNSQWEAILKKQKQIMNMWKPMNLSLRGKEMILKALIQSRALFLATVNGMPKDIRKKMEKQMHQFLWNGGKATMIWNEITQPREKGGLGMPDIEARIEAIDIMWLQKYIAPPKTRPLWALVVDQILFKNVQHAPQVDSLSTKSWILQSWNEHDGKETKLPKFIANMMKTGRKYKIGYDALHVHPLTKNKFPIWHHVAVTNYHLFNKKAAKELRENHNVSTVGDVRKFIRTNGTTQIGNSARLTIAKKLLKNIPYKLNPYHDNAEEHNLDHSSETAKQYKDSDPSLENFLINPQCFEKRTIENSIRIFGNYQRSKGRKLKQHNLTIPPPERSPRNGSPATIRFAFALNKSRPDSLHFVTSGQIKTNNGRTTDYDRILQAKTKSEAKIEAITTALSMGNNDFHLVYHDASTLRKMGKKLLEWEDYGFLGIQNEQAWRTLLWKIRKLKGKLFIRTAQENEDHDTIKFLKERATQSNLNETIQNPVRNIPSTFRIEGARLHLLSQKTAYQSILKQRQITPGTLSTTRNIELIKKHLKEKTNNNPETINIWEALNQDHIPLRYRDFSWKMIHNRLKVGKWFEHIPGWQDKATCKCGALDDIEHILLQCPLNKTTQLWALTEKLWIESTAAPWIKPNLGILMAPATVQLPKTTTTPKIHEHTKYHQLIAETAWIIWLCRNKRIFNNNELTMEEARMMWNKTYDTKLMTEWRSIMRISDSKIQQAKISFFKSQWQVSDKIIRIDRLQNLTSLIQHL